MTTAISELERHRHIEEAMKLDAMGYRLLFFMQMTPPTGPDVLLYFTPLQEVTWQGKTFINHPCNITGYRRAGDDEQSRPKFSIVNPDGVFTKYAHEGWLDNATIVRYHVLKEHLLNDVNSFVKHTWRVSRIVSSNKDIVVTELRGATDGQQFIMPAGQYMPPKFPQVSF